MIKGKLANLIAGIVGLALAAFIYFYANTFPNAVNELIGPDFFPKLMATGLAIATVCHLITTMLTKVPKDFGPLSPADPGVRRILFCLLGTIVFAFLIKPLGFIPSSALFMFGICYLLGMRKYVMMAAVSICVPLVVALGFQYGLKIFLPPGILEPILYGW